MSSAEFIRYRSVPIVDLQTGSAGQPATTLSPGESTIAGNECHLALDVTDYDHGPGSPEDVTADVADKIDKETGEESGLYPVEVIEIEESGK